MYTITYRAQAPSPEAGAGHRRDQLLAEPPAHEALEVLRAPVPRRDSAGGVEASPT